MLETQYYGEFGGAYLPEILVSTFEELAAAFREAQNDAGFWEQYKNLMSTYSCRPTPLTFADVRLPSSPDTDPVTVTVQSAARAAT